MNDSEGQPPVVRMFPDYADTVLWFGGPVPYDESGLSEGLVRELEDWEQSYCDSLTPDEDWKSSELARQFTAEGNRLAQRVADELGDGYEVQFSSYEPGVPPRRFRGARSSLNPQAAAAFGELEATLIAEQEKSDNVAGVPDGDNSEWFAVAPLTGAIFRPHR
ncbi:MULTISPECIES: hypothetical protein [Micrococcaceae]|uniref:hypothetical protein n=1 Tax=Micrococcaceae TaxID=1268 RepID=UPI00160F2FCA|nr:MULTISPECIES: hypothetical protein [Micrococcaceae]MBB5748735.1 hypothetical protein [Micrococcus sp. TA1]HRO29007.1 hypothetical protein [Citricoccus sp.]